MFLEANFKFDLKNHDSIHFCGLISIIEIDVDPLHIFDILYVYRDNA